MNNVEKMRDRLLRAPQQHRNAIARRRPRGRPRQLPWLKQTRAEITWHFANMPK